MNVTSKSRERTLKNRLHITLREMAEWRFRAEAAENRLRQLEEQQAGNARLDEEFDRMLAQSYT